MTWTKFWKRVAFLYALSLLGFLMKVAVQPGWLHIQNVWQVLVVLFLPVMHMFWFALILFGYLAFKRFDIGKATGLVAYMGWIYVVYLISQLISTRQL